MLAYLTFIFSCQLAGEVIARATGLPVPGPVLGMVFLFVFLTIRGSVPAPLAKTGDALLGHLSLLFVPAGVGVMLHARLIERDLLPIGAALIGSTALTVAVTALMMNWLGRRARGEAHDAAGTEE